jgi:hypothetical protein
MLITNCCDDDHYRLVSQPRIPAIFITNEKKKKLYETVLLSFYENL